MATQRDLKLDDRDLDPSRHIWRYIKLSTLIYLLTKKRSFIPKLTTLQHGDPFEGRMRIWDFFQDHTGLKAKLKTHKDWLRRTKSNGGTLADWEVGLQTDIVEIWMRELARRRVVWCWHESEHECMGQWRIYGKEAGVAIRSDVESVLRVLSGDGKNRDVAYGRVCYLFPSQPLDVLKPSTQYLAWNPIFIKNKVFGHEKEVRFVLSDSENDVEGYSIKTNPADFVKEVIVSPFLLPSEATAVKGLIDSLMEPLLPSDSPSIVKISGALSPSTPDGRAAESWDEAKLEKAADAWFENNSSESLAGTQVIPSILSLFPLDCTTPATT